MPYTISGTYSTLVTLGSLSDNPTTITAEALLNDGLSVTYPDLSVVNAGRVIGGNDGIYLLSGGRVTNQTGGTISGSLAIDGGGTSGQSLTVVNYGVIFGGQVDDGAAVDLSAGGSVYNQLDGTISGYDGVFAVNVPATVVNAGYITAASSGSAAYGVYLGLGGTVTNLATGTISGGIVAEHAPAAVTNYGLVAGEQAGVFLADGGSITNQSGGTISGGEAILALQGAATIDNAGTIMAPGSGVVLVTGGSVTNQASGTISGNGGGVSFLGANASADNLGYIDSSAGVGVYLADGGVVTNGAAGATVSSAYIGGYSGGVKIESANAGTLTNYGTISGLPANNSVQMYTGTVVNGPSGATGALIEAGGGDGVYINSAGMVINDGQIESRGQGKYYGVKLGGAGIISNPGTASLIQGSVGAYAQQNDTVTNAGTIGSNYGPAGIALAFGGGTNRLIVDPGATFIGTVSGGGPVAVMRNSGAYTIGTANGLGTTTLELASGASVGTLSGLGTKYVDFAQVTLDAGAQWTLTGGNTLGSGDTITNAGTLTLSNGTLSGAAALINNGAIVLDPSTMTIASLTGSGLVTIEAGSTLDVTGVIASTETIVFAGSGASLLLGTPESAAGSVTGFAAGDTIDLAGIAPASVSDAGGELSFAGGSFPLTSAISLVIVSDGNGGTDIVPCFVAGTRIATPSGSVTVEALQTGDLVRTASGDVRPVRWIGCRTIDPARHPAPGQVQPIRIAAGAFAEGMPSRTLRLSPDHAVLLHGLLIPIKLLRNDASVTREIDCRSVTYYHVELDAHDILLAEGLETESYLDTGNRAMFENVGLPAILHPDITNDQARRKMESCAPFADQPTVVEPIWRTLVARAEQMGLAVPPMPETTDDPALHLMVDGRRCAPVSVAHGCYIFLIARNTSEVRLVSRRAERHKTSPWVADNRRLGVQLRAMTIRCGGAVLPVPLDHPLLADGWWEPEWHAATTLRRWTKGDAVVPVMEAGPGPLVLEVEVAETVPYPLPIAAKEAGARRV